MKCIGAGICCAIVNFDVLKQMGKNKQCVQGFKRSVRRKPLSGGGYSPYSLWKATSPAKDAGTAKLKLCHEGRILKITPKLRNETVCVCVLRQDN